MNEKKKKLKSISSQVRGNMEIYSPRTLLCLTIGRGGGVNSRGGLVKFVKINEEGEVIFHVASLK